MHRIVAAVVAGLLAGPVLAEGDAGKGEKGFKKCKSCHEIVSDAGDVIVKGGKTGPNLYGITGKPIASVDFKYSDSLVALGEGGETWNEENFVAWLTDPKAFLIDKTGDSKARSKMSFKLKKGGEDIYAYLVSVSQ